MEPWTYVVVAAAATVAPAVVLTLLCRTETEKAEEDQLPRWARAKAMVNVALGGGNAVAAVRQSDHARAKPDNDTSPKRND